MLKPLADKVVVKVIEKEQSVSGFVLASNSQSATKTAEVVAVGEGLRALNGELIELSVVAGQTVLFEGHAGISVKDGDEEFLLIRESDILAIVE
ncbi:co-chaperone GroES [Streptococcus danieliae]|uniref:Co-chaperonin GroES n=1 Tax=Streptococcus danieliae TaxID=747656 RepID=A0A7Z0LDI0_9STRE|nr:co-chaperone GroES [Streptococcus danieliae]MBF0717341.1 co-chaperone GroES [Streptococcus danieliae]NYS49271.1 co-chaperone GroES [Streptococcus danieliae]